LCSGLARSVISTITALPMSIAARGVSHVNVLINFVVPGFS
jgi:hypothetical protein